MRKNGIIVALAFPLVFVLACDPGCGPTPMPVVQITPWVPQVGLNPLVLSVTVKVSNKGPYAFLDSSGATTSKLIVAAKDKMGLVIGAPIEQNIAVSNWGDGEHKIPLSDSQKTLYQDGKTKTVTFEVAVVCQKGTEPAGKVTDTEVFTKP